MKKLLTRIVDVKPNELRALWLGFAFHFLILSGYYITKPIRDSIGASSSMEALPWMFTATLVTMLIANAAFAATVARMSRRKFIPLAYGFFIVVFTLFFIAMRSRPATLSIPITLSAPSRNALLIAICPTRPQPQIATCLPANQFIGVFWSRRTTISGRASRIGHQ